MSSNLHWSLQLKHHILVELSNVEISEIAIIPVLSANHSENNYTERNAYILRVKTVNILKKQNVNK